MGTSRQNLTKKNKANIEPKVGSRDPHVHPLEELQETFGNQALGRLIESQSYPEQPADSSPNLLLEQISTTNNSPIQRRSLFPGLSHELIGNVQGNLVQAKLTVSQPGDKYEQEADRVASQLVKQINKPASELLDDDKAIQGENLMPKSVSSAEPVAGGVVATQQLETAIKQDQGEGQPISEDIREPIEQSFGVNFSGVRIHTDTQSDKLNHSIESIAFTKGQDIFFKQGAYQPRSSQGQELLVHELTHVVQQNSTSVLQTKIQRTKEDGKPDKLNLWALDPETFKEKTNKLLSVFSKRGKYLQEIDKWLKAVQETGNWEKQQYALLQVNEACQAFLEDNFKMMQGGLKEKDWDRNQAVRKMVVDTQLKASQFLDSPSIKSSLTNSPSTDANMEESGVIRGRVKNIAEGGLGIMDTTSGTFGGYDDIHGTKHGDRYKSDYLDTANVVGGVLNSYNAGKELISKENGVKDKIGAGGSLVAGVGQTSHGLAKSVKVVGGLAKDGEFKLGDQFGEIGGAVGDATGAFSGLISTTTEIFGLCRNWKKSTVQEKLDSSLGIIQDASSTAQSGVKTASGVIKSIKEVSGVELPGGSALGSAAAIIGIVTGSIQSVRGAFDVYRGSSLNRTAKEIEDGQNKIITKISEDLHKTKILLPNLFATGNREKILELGEKMQELSKTIVELQELQIGFAPTLEAIKKIGNKRMEEGGMKIAGGALGIVSGALILSGVGAPIAISIGALSGLLALSYAGVKIMRNREANSLIDIAQRLSDDGKPKAKPDSKPDYRIMEKRIYKCYYNHIPYVLVNRPPDGMEKSDFSKVKAFTWEDKRERVDDSEKVTINKPSEADGLEAKIKENKWIEVRDSKNTITHREKPTESEKLKLVLTPSARKSKQSLNTSKEELATILTLLCLQSYDNTTRKFINSQIKPMGEADPQTLAEFANITLMSLLSATNITEERWSGWFDKLAGDEVKLREKVLNHIS